MSILQGKYGQKARNYIAEAKCIVFFNLGDTVKVRVSENSSPLSLTHAEDFGKYFPDIDLSPPKRSD